MEDLSMVKKGPLKMGHLYTIRKGEAVHDNVEGGVVNASREMIKVREKDEGVCVFYAEEGKACSIYEGRPVQCAALQCWDTKAFMEVYKGPKLDRRSVVDNDILTGLMEGHEKRCSYEILEEHVKKIAVQGEKAIEEVLRILQFDFELNKLNQLLLVHLLLCFQLFHLMMIGELRLFVGCFQKHYLEFCWCLMF